MPWRKHQPHLGVQPDRHPLPDNAFYLDAEILEEFRVRADKAGYGYQTMINDALREYLSKSGKPLDETVIRQVIREELDRVAHH